MDFIKKNFAGVLVCLIIAIPSYYLGQLYPIIGGPVFAILLGMIICLLWTNRGIADAGIKFTSKKILQYAVILLGFGLNLGTVLKTGQESLPIIISTIATSLIVAFVSDSSFTFLQIIFFITALFIAKCLKDYFIRKD